MRYLLEWVQSYSANSSGAVLSCCFMRPNMHLSARIGGIGEVGGEKKSVTTSPALISSPVLRVTRVLRPRIVDTPLVRKTCAL